MAMSVKIVILGEARVGKTSLMMRYIKNEFSQDQISTIDATFLEKSIQVGQQPMKLAIWDTAGQERYHALNSVYYRGASGALIVYDVTDLDSWQKVQQWSLELRKYLDANTPIIIAGNKCDMPMSAQTVDKSMAEDFARQNEYTHVSTSAKSGHNVEETFALIGQKIIEKQQNQTESPEGKVYKKSKRGVMRVEGIGEFNPDMDGGVKLTRQSQAVSSGAKSTKDGGKEKKKGGCC